MTAPEPDLRCERTRLLLSLRADGAATEDQGRELDEHLAACAACRAAGGVDRAVHARMQERANEDVPAGFAARTLAAVIADRAVAAAQNRFLRRCAAAAVIAAAATVTWGRFDTPARDAGVASARAATENAVFPIRLRGR